MQLAVADQKYCGCFVTLVCATAAQLSQDCLAAQHCNNGVLGWRGWLTFHTVGHTVSRTAAGGLGNKVNRLTGWLCSTTGLTIKKKFGWGVSGVSNVLFGLQINKTTSPCFLLNFDCLFRSMMAECEML